MNWGMRMDCGYCLEEKTLTFTAGANGELAVCGECGGTSRLFVDPACGTAVALEARCPHGVECPPDAADDDDMAGFCQQCDDDVAPVVAAAVAHAKASLN